MFLPPPDRNERLLKYALIALGVTLVLAMLSVLYFDSKTSSRSGKAPETVLTPETELKLQEQVAPLIKAGDMAACDQVKNDMYRKVCINNIALNKAEETKDISYCQYLDDEFASRIDCERGIIFEQSLARNDVSVCAEAKEDSLREECEKMFYVTISISEQDPNLCQNAKNPGECRDVFYAKKTLNGEAIDCNSVLSEQARGECQSLQTLLSDTKGKQQELIEFCQNGKTKFSEVVCMGPIAVKNIE